MPRLRRTHPGQPGWTRRRRGKGWQYLDDRGRPIADADALLRIRSLAIPPAWTEVWICSVDNGHLQAVGTDVAGRRQYRYHDDWSTSRSQLKFTRVLQFGRILPSARKVFATDLALTGLTRERVLAVAASMLDAGYFRIGNASYAEKHGSIGLSTLQRAHVRKDGDAWQFSYVAKSGVDHVERIAEPDLAAAIGTLMRRRSGPEELLVHRDGKVYRSITGDDINTYLKDALADIYSAKDFRTWRGTVLAAVALAVIELDDPPPADRPRTRALLKRRIKQAVTEVSERLGNTPTVCRTSYIDPRVVEAFEQGTTIATQVRRHRRSVADAEDEIAALSRVPAIEKAVITLLDR